MNNTSINVLIHGLLRFAIESIDEEKYPKLSEEEILKMFYNERENKTVFFEVAWGHYTTMWKLYTIKPENKDLRIIRDRLFPTGDNLYKPEDSKFIIGNINGATEDELYRFSLNFSTNRKKIQALC